MQRITKRDMFLAIIADLEKNNSDRDLVAFAMREIELLDKQAARPTKIQIENEDIKVKILTRLATAGEGQTATQVAKSIGITTQKATALLRQLTLDNQVTRIEAVGKAPVRFFA